MTTVAARVIRVIQRYSAKQFSVDRAMRNIENLFAIFAMLAELPEIGVSHQFGSSSFQLFASGQHIVVFEPMKHAIAILTIVHRARHIDPLLVALEPTVVREIER